MFLTVHAAAGILIGQQIQNPILAFLIGLFSHFLIDMVPHGDEELETWLKKYKNKKRVGLVVLVDFILSILLSIFFIQKITIKHAPAIIAAITGSTLPDFLYLIWHPWKIFNKPPRKISIKLIKFHQNIQELLKKDLHLPIKYALGLQLITIILLTFLIL